MELTRITQLGRNSRVLVLVYATMLLCVQKWWSTWQPRNNSAEGTEERKVRRMFQVLIPRMGSVTL
jgi:hypothetical protein